MQLQLAVGAVAEGAHRTDAQGNHIAGGERANVGDRQPAHHLRVLRAPRQLGAIRVAQAPAVAGEVTVEQLVGQLAEGECGVGSGVLDPRLQGPQLALGQCQQQCALRLEQAGELVDQEGLASTGEALHGHRLVDTTEEFA
ncbi:hypothetical protein D9M71_733510 [compost metagenome]